MSARTILLLDVDGTLSPLPLPGFDTDHDHTLTFTDGTTQQVSARWRRFTGPDWLCTTGFGPVPFRPALVARLNTLIGSGAVEPRWLTSWDDTANRLTDTGLTGVPWPVEPRGTGPVGGKVTAVARALTEHPHTRVVWCDDDIDARLAAVRALHAAHGDRLLTVRPKRTYGLTDTDVDRIAAFAR